MQPNEERCLKRMCQRMLGLRQGVPAARSHARARAFCAAIGKGYSTLLNEINPNGCRSATGRAKLGVATVVALCRFARDARPVLYLARLVRDTRANAAARRAARASARRAIDRAVRKVAA